MSAGLDMSLDDIIRSSKGSRGSGPPRSRGRGAGPRRFQNPNPYRAAPYVVSSHGRDLTFYHPSLSADLPFHPQAGQGPLEETATKIYVSNLDYGVSNEDIRELFSDVGIMKEYGIHFDRTGRSEGTAEVVFSQRAEALAAVKRYNNVELDGKPMKIELVGTSLVTSVAPPPVMAPFRNFSRDPRWSQGSGGPMGRRRGGGRRVVGSGRGRGRGERAEKVSAEDLDADLDKYHSEAVQVN